MNNVENAVAGFKFDDKLDEKRLQEEFQKGLEAEVNDNPKVKEPNGKKINKKK